jgi:hypothetical protein
LPRQTARLIAQALTTSEVVQAATAESTGRSSPAICTALRPPRPSSQRDHLIRWPRSRAFARSQGEGGAGENPLWIKGRFFPHLPGKPLIMRQSRTISSESSLFNGLCGSFAERKFSRPFAQAAAPERGTWGRGHEDAQNYSPGKLSVISDFRQSIVFRQKSQPYNVAIQS